MISIIAAVSANNAIGINNKLIYWLPNDLKRFKALTTGHTIVMGRKTFESLPKGALPNRRNVVLSRTTTQIDGCEVYSSLDEALKHTSSDEEIFIIGGASVYEQALSVADRLCLTEIDDIPAEADTFFPEYKMNWKENWREDHDVDERHSHRYSFVDYVRNLVIALFLCFAMPSVDCMAQDALAKAGAAVKDTAAAVAPKAEQTAETAAVVDDELLADGEESAADSLLVADAETGMYAQLKTKFVEGGVEFMSLVAIALVIGLTICIERIIYLSMSEIDAKKFMASLEEKYKAEGVEAAKDLCRNTRGPVASICYQGFLRIGESVENIERSVSAYGAVQVANLEKGCSWIRLLIAMAPSLGFLGTVIGMVMAFDNIQNAGDISPTIVAEGMKVALITTIFGIITALILQLFYNYILSKIEHLTSQMEESAITLMDMLRK